MIDVFTKYDWVKHLKDKYGKTVLHGFIEIVNESKRKQSKLWIDQGRDFYNRPMQKWVDNNDILMYLTNNVGNWKVYERFIWILKGKFYKRMTANDTKSYLHYLNNLVDEYKNSYPRSIGKKTYWCWLFCIDYRNWLESESS